MYLFIQNRNVKNIKSSYVSWPFLFDKIYCFNVMAHKLTIASISMSACLGSDATCTVVLAGKAP